MAGQLTVIYALQNHNYHIILCMIVLNYAKILKLYEKPASDGDGYISLITIFDAKNK